MVAALVLGGALAGAPAAGAAQTHNGAEARDFATGFTHQDRRGPIGVAFDPAGRLYVGSRDGIHRFGPGGGRVGPSTLVAAAPPGTHVTGLAFDRDGRLYAAYVNPDRRGGVNEVDPVTGALVRRVLTNVLCPVGLAIDPVGGAMFVSQVECQERIIRVPNPRSANPQARTFVSGYAVDGLTFGPDGTLYAAHHPVDGATVSRYDRSGSRTGIANVPAVDGVALGRDGTFLIANGTDGNVRRVELGDGRTSDVMTGGSRGDLVAVGPDGCLYATQTDRVLKITNAGGGCTDVGARGPLGAGLAATSPIASASAVRRARCDVPRAVRIAPRFGRTALRRVRIYVDGRLRRTVSGRALRRDVLIRRGLPDRAFVVTVRGTTRRGRTVTRRLRYGGACGCRSTRRLTVPTAALRRAGAVRLRISIGTRVVRRVSRRGLRRRVVITAPGRPFTLTIRATTRSGRTIVTRRDYGCAS